MEPRDKIIKLVVANTASGTEVLNVHQGVLCKSSGFFKRAMRPEWLDLRESPDTIELPDDPLNTVSDYIRWLYTATMPLKLYRMRDEDTREKIAEESEKVFILLAQAYVFGEKIIDAKYKNTVVKSVLEAKESAGWNMGPESVTIVYNGTPSGSPLRRLIADNIARLAYDDSDKGIGWMSFFDGCPKEALVDAMKATVRTRAMVGHEINRNVKLLETYFEDEQESDNFT
ncbi:uncharacterized protein K460DRAFT_313111 [Cucurbitaria berberidis CBS 394.84]|uniref:BTB domain-containing protein n=1 Tax=Cucurbitaria berberidis CBS 394.84 TaxID=1168544 RepID=A0A9P4L8G1_9PLEO|nr:uncharacterized protein K460DRAFT_313111 [Cucurbitaria berberidis CBS 394.84]KAF1846051.1 hypothetical protein K460DRAFT_313111 [Cucurbitaria berberidis CBS 394.84]